MNVWLLVRGEAEFRREALEVLERLRGHVVKVDEVHHGVHDREEEGGARANLQGLDTQNPSRILQLEFLSISHNGTRVSGESPVNSNPTSPDS